MEVTSSDTHTLTHTHASAARDKMVGGVFAFTFRVIFTHVKVCMMCTAYLHMCISCVMYMFIFTCIMFLCPPLVANCTKFSLHFFEVINVTVLWFDLNGC